MFVPTQKFKTITTTTSPTRSRSYGYTTNMGQTGVLPILSQLAEDWLCKAMLGLHSKFTTAMAKKYDANTLVLKTRPFT
eukprot:1265689-Karenia_brevis.AAC.1